MDPGIAYALLAALVWGTYVFSLKRYFRGYPATLLTVLVNVFAIAWYLPVAVLTLPAGAVPDLSAVTPAVVAVVLATELSLAGALVLFLRALAAGDVSYVTPINKIVPVFVLPIEYLLLDERLTPLQLAGVLVATLAVYVANYRRGSLLDPFRRAVTSRPAGLALVSAALYAVSDVGKRVALQELGLPMQVWVLVVFTGVLVLLAPWAVRSWSESPAADGFRADLPKFVLAGAAVATGEHITSLAFLRVSASIASPIINTQAIVAVVLGGVLLREESFGARLAAAGLAVAGVSLIAV